MSKKTLIKTVLLLLLVPVLLFKQFLEYRYLLPLGLMSTGLLVLVGATEASEKQTDRLIFINESSSQISSVMLLDGLVDGNRVHIVEGDEELVIEWETWPCEVVASDAEGREVARLTITEDPQVDMDRDQWYVIAQDSPEGVVLTLSHRDDLKKVLKWGKEHSGLDLSEGIVRTFIYRHGWMGDGDTLLVMTFTPEQGAELERAMAQTNGWHPFPVHEVIDRIFFHKGSYCRDLNNENYLPPVENGWYFFRDMYNVQHGENDENQWNIGDSVPRNFDAGIYDSDTQTLYLFEFDS